MVEFNWNAPIIDEDNAEWLKTMSWGGLPEEGQAFMEYMSWYDLPRAEQREALEDFIDSPRGRNMPENLKTYFRDMGLLD